MKKTYTTPQAAKRIGVSFPTLHRWLRDGKIRPQGIPLADRTLWVWTEQDISRGREVKAQQRPGPRPKKGGAK